MGSHFLNSEGKGQQRTICGSGFVVHTLMIDIRLEGKVWPKLSNAVKSFD
jgi:hypothetical protein